jgi:hypothetical protein
MSGRQKIFFYIIILLEPPRAATGRLEMVGFVKLNNKGLLPVWSHNNF